jgi:hypothetical protein
VEEAKTAARAVGKVVLALAKKRSLLHAFATARKLDVKDRLRAIELDAKLAGELKGDAVTVHATAVSGYVLTPERQAEIAAKKRAATERRLARMGLEQPQAAELTNWP